MPREMNFNWAAVKPDHSYVPLPKAILTTTHKKIEITDESAIGFLNNILLMCAVSAY